MRCSIFALSLTASFSIPAQEIAVTITDREADKKGSMDADLKALYGFLGVDRYVAELKVPGRSKCEVVLVLKSVWKDSLGRVDTLVNTEAWKKKVVGGFPWDTKEPFSFMAQREDSMHYKVMGRVGMAFWQRLVLPWPNHGYSLADGIGSYESPVKAELGKPFPIMVLTQPYPDPPAPKDPVIYRYCFSGEVPPDQWPAVFGVPHLFIFEVTILP